MNKRELKLEYKRLARAGKNKEADKVIDKIRRGDFSNDKNNSKVVKKENKKKTTRKKSVKREKRNSKRNFDDLQRIRGIGKETIKDIKRIYESEEKMIEALENGTVPLRNDVVKKLKVYYKL